MSGPDGSSCGTGGTKACGAGGSAISRGIGTGGVIIAGGGGATAAGGGSGRTPIEGWMAAAFDGGGGGGAGIATGGAGANIAGAGGAESGRAAIDAGIGSCDGVSVGATSEGVRKRNGAAIGSVVGDFATAGGTDGAERAGAGATDGAERGGAGGTDGATARGASLMRAVAGAMLAGGALARSFVSSASASFMSGGSVCAVAASSRALRASGTTNGGGVFAMGATPAIVFRMFERAGPPGRGIRGAPSVLSFRPSDPTTAAIQKLK